MKSVRGWSMRRKMLLSYAVPVILISLLVFVIGASVIFMRVQSQTRTNTEQAIGQAESYLSFYLQNMEYVAEILCGNEELLELLSDPSFGTTADTYESYLEYYELNVIFGEIEVSNMDFRIGMYVPDEAVYADNNYYFYSESSLKQREDYADIEEALSGKGEVYILAQDKQYATSSSIQDMLVLLKRLDVVCQDGTGASYVIKVEVPLRELRTILQNAALSQDCVLYVLNEDNELVFSNQDSLEEETAAALPTRASSDWDTVTWSRQRCYLLQEDFTHNSWKLLYLLPVKSYSLQFIWLLYWFLGVMGCVLVCVVVTSYGLSRYYTNRIGTLNLKMDEVQKGSLITHVQYPSEHDSRDELDQLNDSFDVMIGEVRELMKEQYRLGRSVTQAEMKALQAQINPHFLYNTLDLINWGAMDYGADEVAELARNLGQLYRLSLNHGHSAISVEDELRHVQAFYNIENVHYEGAIRMEVEVPADIRSLACLNIILQPFVENAIVHGIGEHEEISSCSIVIRAWREEDDVVFSVEDDGPGIDPETARSIEEAIPGKGSVGYGISNVNFRIKLTYGDRYGVEYVLDSGRRGTQARIRIRALGTEELEALVP